MRPATSRMTGRPRRPPPTLPASDPAAARPKRPSLSSACSRARPSRIRCARSLSTSSARSPTARSTRWTRNMCARWPSGSGPELHFTESLSTDSWRELRRCAPHGSLPPVGEGQGEGWRRSTEREVGLVHRLENERCCVLDHRYETEAVRVVSLSLSLPHRGGGNVVAPLCLTSQQHSRTCFPKRQYAGTKGCRFYGVTGLKRWIFRPRFSAI